MNICKLKHLLRAELVLLFFKIVKLLKRINCYISASLFRDETAHCSGSSCSFSYKDICTPEVAEVTYSKTTPLMITIKGSSKC